MCDDIDIDSGSVCLVYVLTGAVLLIKNLIGLKELSYKKLGISILL